MKASSSLVELTPTARMMKTNSEPRGLLLVDKTKGLTSHDVVARTRRRLGTRKVGHAGTLDPMATGLLVLGIGRGTKLLNLAVGLDKEYKATIRLGASTTTDDAEGEIIDSPGCNAIPDIEAVLERYRGDIEQIPSSVSAIKVDGKRAYARVRAGETVQLKARPVTVSAFDIVGAPRLIEGYLDLDVRVQCSSGTYIRALARDIGNDLGVGGHLTALRRTAVGPWRIEQASEELRSLEQACVDLVPQACCVDDEEAIRFRHGDIQFSHGLASDGNGMVSVKWKTKVLGIVGALHGKIKALFIIDPA